MVSSGIRSSREEKSSEFAYVRFLRKTCLFLVYPLSWSACFPSLPPALPGWERLQEELPVVSQAEGGAAGACLGPTEGSGGLQRCAFPAARRLWQDDAVTRTATVSEPKPFTSVRAGRSHETPVVSRTWSPFCHSH